MSRNLLNPDAIGDRPVFRGEPVDPLYLDEDAEIVDDESSAVADAEDDSAWFVDTGAGEFTAPVDRRVSDI